MRHAPRVPVLMYHRVGDAHNEWEARYAIPASTFAAHTRAIARAGYRPVAIDALVDWLNGGPRLPEGALLITFDDGFRGVREHALPVLERLGWPFSVFLVSGLIGQADEWTRSANPDGVTHPLLDREEILDMQKRGCTFHSHTRTHPSLPDLDDERLAEELQRSRQDLAALVGQPVDYLAYPFGRHDERVEAAARAAGYRAAFSTQPGFNRQDVDHFRIRRLDIAGTDSATMLLRKIRLGSNDGTLGTTLGYYLQRINDRVRGVAR